MTSSSQASEAKEEIKPWIRRFGRFGYMAKGAVYGIVGVLAFMAAIGVGGKTTGTSGMLRSLAGVPFGEILLWLVGIGLIGYIVWDFIKAIKNPQNKGAISRIGYAVSGVIYGALAFNAIKIAMNAGSSSGNSEQTMSAKLLSQPFGQWIIGAIGVIIIGYGLYELFTGVTGRFMKKFKIGQMDRHEQNVARKSGKMGLTARGVVLGLIGYFFVQTALTANPDQAKGLDGALSELAQKPHGQWILGVVALGLILYGVYQIIRGRHEHMSFGKIK
ncbi:DUF1206 domain-containing protein [Halobacillus sp. BBL2006]|uniref:DUF1206 domain-containing protein n=1 Tax=Halobacillus sp. BBL2006 TaxID=1543706 RepID=UPI000543163B|nr:DUF1206 domain-containing protein [Halobacillus sp. BBL2006]KHE71468.1 membrane protein [Halobacillus sp. BBL2006]